MKDWYVLMKAQNLQSFSKEKFVNSRPMVSRQGRDSLVIGSKKLLHASFHKNSYREAAFPFPKYYEHFSRAPAVPFLFL